MHLGKNCLRVSSGLDIQRINLPRRPVFMDQTNSLTECIKLFFADDKSSGSFNDEKVYALVKKMSASILGQHYSASDDFSKTALSNEALIKLINSPVEYKDRVHFFATLSKAMRQVVIDYLRKKNSIKRKSESDDEYVEDMHGGEYMGV